MSSKPSRGTGLMLTGKGAVDEQVYIQEKKGVYRKKSEVLQFFVFKFTRMNAMCRYVDMSVRQWAGISVGESISASAITSPFQIL
jgi:hypothetical protein